MRFLTLSSLNYVFDRRLGTVFLKRFKDAVLMRDKQKSTFEQFSSTFSVETVGKWEEMISEWRKDKSKLNPFKEPTPCKCC